MTQSPAPAEAESPVVAETVNLTKRYGPVLTVDNLSLSIQRGGVFGLLGPNGSGKTTTMSMLLGLAKPTSGTIRLFGHDTRSHHAEGLRRVGAIVEAPSFYPYLSGRDNLRYFQGINGRAPQGPAHPHLPGAIYDVSVTEIDRLLALVDLTSRGGSKYATYSLGMKQRLGIAYALLGSPELVLLDEPTNGLDPAGMAEVRDLVKSLGQGGLTVLLSSHLLHEVEQVCERVAILSKGKLLAQGRVQDLIRQRSVVHLKTTDNAKAGDILRHLPWVADVHEEGGELAAAAPYDRAWELTAVLAEGRVYVSEMAPARVSLEQYFLEVTGDDDERSGASSPGVTQAPSPVATSPLVKGKEKGAA